LRFGVLLATLLELVPAFANQDAQFSTAFAILENAITAHAFPAASVAGTQNRRLVALRAFGRFTGEASSPEAQPETIFDLASVSKVVATTTMAALLYEQGLLDLEMPLISIVAEFGQDDPRRDEVTLRMLLAHSSGLPAYEKLYLRAQSRDELLAAAVAVPLACNPGSHAEYSDIGFILLGLALERLADDTLDHCAQHRFLARLG